MTRADIRLRTRQLRVREIVDELRNNTIEFTEMPSANCAVLEYIPTYVPFPLMFRPVWKISEKGNILVDICLCGHGFLSALTAYIIRDEVMTEPFLYDDWKGKRFSELSWAFKRSILDMYINVWYDESFLIEDSTEVGQGYANLIKDVL